GYLRHHFRSMEQYGPVSFDEELEHTRFYLSIEKMRFGDELNVEYDIEDTDFELPPLSLQPIAENAVRHGIREKNGRGTVTIRSYRTDEACVVEVEDDGAGFDTSILGEQEPDTEHNRIALRNVSVRVEQLCQGQLSIDSTPGKGTVVTISIPIKKET
ncbi:MAG: ATP-binding protein, partial [Lachnospiraceae bacterium]|nr:ATP-binding protein [Lachnospiraceae bacterium]